MSSELTPSELYELANDLKSLGERITVLAKTEANMVLGTKMQVASCELMHCAEMRVATEAEGRQSKWCRVCMHEFKLHNQQDTEESFGLSCPKCPNGKCEV